MKRFVWVTLFAVSYFSFAREKKFCAGIRGNGDYIMAHFGAMSNLTESYGVLDGIAGGSSGSITAFLYESILMNKWVTQCGRRPCNPKEKARRVALFLKAAPEIIEVMKKSNEALAIRHLISLQAEMKAKGIGELLKSGKATEAGNAIKTLLQSKEFVSVINPEVFQLIQKGRSEEVYDQIMNFGKFEASDPRIFFRPGFINFGAAPDIFGKVADFYAGRGPVNEAAMKAFLKNCSRPDDVGKDWFSLKESCRTDFNKMYTDYRSKYDTAPKFRHRKDSLIGSKLPTLISTSVVDGAPANREFQKVKEEYLASKDLNPLVSFKPGFESIKFGYWGRENDLKEIAKKFEGSTDRKSQKFLSLGQKKWSDALKLSPAEPGLASGQNIDSERVSLGGWSDLHPVQALKAMGCKHVIYVTRQGTESDFAMGVARQLGMDQKEEDKLYTLKNGNVPEEELSSYQRAIKMADAIYCTNWNKSTPALVKEMVQEAYNAPVVSQDEFFQKPLNPGGKKPIGSLKAPGCDASTGSAPAERGSPSRPPTHD